MPCCLAPACLRAATSASARFSAHTVRRTLPRMLPGGEHPWSLEEVCKREHIERRTNEQGKRAGGVRGERHHDCPTLSTYCSGVSVKSRPAMRKVTSGMLAIRSHSTTACANARCCRSARSSASSAHARSRTHRAPTRRTIVKNHSCSSASPVPGVAHFCQQCHTLHTLPTQGRCAGAWHRTHGQRVRGNAQGHCAGAWHSPHASASTAMPRATALWPGTARTQVQAQRRPGTPHAWEEDMKERVSHAPSSCPMICSCVWWFASAICATGAQGGT